MSPLSTDTLPWYLGAVGELEVGHVLDRLGPGWTAIHAIPVGSAASDIDHLVIGPGGLFTINSKHHEGKRIWVGATRLLVNGQRTDHLRNAAFEGKRVARIMSSAARTAVDVTPLVVIVGERGIVVRDQPREVVVLSSRRLVEWLKRRPAALGEGEVNALTRIALDPTTWGSPALSDADLEGFAALRESVATARRRRRWWAAGGMLGMLAVLVAAWAALPAALLGLI